MIGIKNCSPYLLLSTAQVAAVLGLSKGAVRKLARDGRLRTITGFEVDMIRAKPPAPTIGRRTISRNRSSSTISIQPWRPSSCCARF